MTLKKTLKHLTKRDLKHSMGPLIVIFRQTLQGKHVPKLGTDAAFMASMNWNVHSMYIRTMNPQTHSPDTFVGGIIPFHTQNENHVNVK